MATVTWCTGFEYGLAAPVTSGAGLFDAVVGAPSIQAVTKRTGGYALEVNNTGGAAASYCTCNLATPTVLVGRCYINLAAWPASPSVQFIKITTTEGTKSATIGVNLGGKHISYGITGTGYLDAILMALNTWYRIDFIFNVSANPWTLDVRIDGEVDASSQTSTTAATTLTGVQFGVVTSVNLVDIFIDDIALSQTSGDYPLGAGGVIGLRPNIDGVHNNAANVMEDSAGNDIHATNFPAFGYLDETPWITTANADYVRQTATGATRYCEINFADTTETIIQGARAILQYASATTNANSGATIIMDSNDQVTNLYGTTIAPADMSEETAFYKSVMVTAPAGGWTMAHVNALRARFGYSDDANPDPYWLAMMLEVPYGTVDAWRPKVIGPF